MIIVLVIVCSGLIIFLYNLAKGNNLYRPGQVFDFREYLEPKDYEPFFYLKMEELAQKIKFGSFKSDNEKKSEPEAEPGVYFTNFFKQENPSETYDFINEFWKNINASADVMIEDLQAKNCFKIKVPVEKRQERLKKIKTAENFKELKSQDPPVWQVCYKKVYYPEQMNSVLASADVDLVIEENENEYVAKMLNDLNEREKEKINEMYSDVIKIEK